MSGHHKMDLPIVPVENSSAFALLYSIETGLRELIILKLSEVAGTRWARTRLPSDVLEKSRTGLTYEKATPWGQLVPHHPIYYTDFADLRKIIERKENWDDTFASVFVRRELITSTLSELEFIRNRVAHNRKINDMDRIVATAHDKISRAIGTDFFRELSARCTTAPDLTVQLKLLREEAAAALGACCSFQHLRPLESWQLVRKAWWYDDSVLGESLKPIDEYFQTLEAYVALPRGRGTGHVIETWLKSSELSSAFERADVALVKILRTRGEANEHAPR
jgi:hypothetical protein